MEEELFYTLRGYDRQDSQAVSPAMEDYLEMVCRLARAQKPVRVNQLAAMLNVTPPSSSKMVAKLREQGMVDFEPYGIIRLSERGARLGEYLLHRHELLNRLFCLINHSENELVLVERIEHFFSQETIKHIEDWLNCQNQANE